MARRPVDDLSPKNPPVVPGLLDAVASDFAASGYDWKHLIREIVSSHAYQAAAVDARTTAEAMRQRFACYT